MFVVRRFGILRVGLWNGAAQSRSGGLLYPVLLEAASAAGVRGGTVLTAIEGSQSRLRWRTVESEVSSNELPIVLEFADDLQMLQTFLPCCVDHVRGTGIVVLEPAQIHSLSPVQKAKEDLRMNESTSPSSNVEADPSVQGLQVQVYTMESQVIGGKPIYQAVAELLRRHNVLWISTARGMAGFGAQRTVRQPKWPFRTRDVPVVMTILDQAQRLELVLPELTELVGDRALVVSRRVVWCHPFADRR